MTQHVRPGSTNGSHHISCVTASPRIFLNRVSIIRVIQVLLGHSQLDTTARRGTACGSLYYQFINSSENLTRYFSAGFSIRSECRGVDTRCADRNSVRVAFEKSPVHGVGLGHAQVTPSRHSAIPAGVDSAVRR